MEHLQMFFSQYVKHRHQENHSYQGQYDIHCISLSFGQANIFLEQFFCFVTFVTNSHEGIMIKSARRLFLCN